MANQSILISDKVPTFFIETFKNRGFKVDYRPDISQATLKDEIPNHSLLLVRGRVKIGSEELAKASDLKAILRPGAGTDNIDTAGARQRGIKVLNSPEGNSQAVAEHALGLLLSLMRKSFSSFENFQVGRWDRYTFIGEELAAQRVGIIGCGNTGGTFAYLLKKLGCEVMAYDKYREVEEEAIEQVSLEELKRRAMVISFHVPLNEETHHYFDEAFLKNMENPVWLLNTSRGAVVDNEALDAGLRKNHIKGAALDVIEGENDEQKRGHFKDKMTPWISEGKLIVTSHIAGLTDFAQEKIFTGLIERLQEEKIF